MKKNYLNNYSEEIFVTGPVTYPKRYKTSSFITSEFKKFKTTKIIKRFYPTWFENIMNNNNNRWFNMSYIPMPQRSEDFTGAPIVEEPIDSNENALVRIARAPLNSIITNSQSFLGTNWKSNLLLQVSNATAFMICKHKGWNTKTLGPTMKIMSSLVMRYMAGTLIQNPFTSPVAFITLAYDIYNLGSITAQTVNTVKWVGSGVKNTYNTIVGTVSWISNLFYKTTPALKNTSRLTGGDSSSLVLDHANQTITLEQVLINNKPYQFTPENFEIFNRFKDKMTNDTIHTFVDKISYKSTFTDKLAEKYLNMTTDTIQVIQNPVVKQNLQSVSNVNTSSPILNTNNPLMIGEYTNNVFFYF